MKKIMVITQDAGGGHRASTEALLEIIRRKIPDWDARAVSFYRDIVRPLDFLYSLTGIQGEEIYNLMRRGDLAFLSRLFGSFAKLNIRMMMPRALPLIEDFFRRNNPDLVISMINFVNHGLGSALTRALPGVPFVTVVTDFINSSYDWMTAQDHYIICGSATAELQALERGYDRARVHRTSGMVIHPEFYDEPAPDRAAGRRQLGLDPDRPTGLLLFSSYGTGELVRIARRLERTATALQLIILCGRDAATLAEFRRSAFAIPVHAEGFTRRIPHLMGLADFYIGMPGPGLISEAVQKRVPVIVVHNWKTSTQERYPARFVREAGIGMTVAHFRDIGRTVGELLRPENYRRFRTNMEKIENRAVFEVAEILKRIVSDHGTLSQEAGRR